MYLSLYRIDKLNGNWLYKLIFLLIVPNKIILDNFKQPIMFDLLYNVKNYFRQKIDHNKNLFRTTHILLILLLC